MMSLLPSYAWWGVLIFAVGVIGLVGLWERMPKMRFGFLVMAVVGVSFPIHYLVNAGF